MDNLEDMLAQVLSSPEAMEKVSGLAKLLSDSDKDGPPPEHDAKTKDDTTPGPDSGFAFDPAMLGGLMSAIQSDDDHTRLLFAIRPFLSEKRQDRLDRAVKMLRIRQMLPLISALNL